MSKTKENTTLEEINAENVTAKAYELRSLKDKDLYPMLDIVTAALPDDMAPILISLTMGEKTVEEIGATVVYKIVVTALRNASLMQDKIYPMLSDLSGIPVEELPEMPFGTTPSMVWDVVKDAKNASFFTEFSKSF